MAGTGAFDGIVIGSGPNGLVCAAYLAKAGLRIAVVERHEQAGGGATTGELTLPGFRHNVHSNFHAIGAGPVTRDLRLEQYGLRYLYPEIKVDSGRARGVVLDGGDELSASRFVASAVDAPQTLDLTGEQWFGPDVARHVRDYRWADTSLVTLHLALSAPPTYAAASFDGDVSRAYGIYLGADSSAALERQFESIWRGELPEWLQGNGACNTLFDPSQAPTGKHTAFWWPWAPYDLDGSPSKWDSRREEITQRILEEWSRYAPNLRQGTVLATHLFTPLDISRRCINMTRGSHHGGAYSHGQMEAGRPTPSLAHYRTPVEGLYLSGASSHPGGSIHGGPGYVAAGVIARDAGIEPWWTPIQAPARWD